MGIVAIVVSRNLSRAVLVSAGLPGWEMGGMELCRGLSVALCALGSRSLGPWTQQLLPPLLLGPWQLLVLEKGGQQPGLWAASWGRNVPTEG